MTVDEQRRAQQRIADARLARRAPMDGDTPVPAPAPRVDPRSFVVGDRVQDVRSGREGTVSDVGDADGRGDRLFRITFDDGGTGSRPALDLVRRPVPPGTRA